MMKITKTITANNNKVAVEIHEKNTELVWVFLHGWGGSKKVWRQICKRLPCTSVTIDLPGFGESSDLSRPWNINDYRQTVADVVKELDADNIVLVGHSFGGQIAAAIAADNPTWLSGLVLVDAAVVRDSEPKLLSTLGHWLSPLFQLPGMRGLKNLLYDLIGADQPPKDNNLKKTMQDVLRDDQTKKLKSITTPVHVIWGQDDTVTPPDQAEVVMQELSQGTVSIISGGHHVFVDNPKKFIDELIMFRNEL